MILISIYLLLTFIACTAILFNVWRSKQTEDFPLRPNCLITKYPILFLNGKPSLFHFLKYWSGLPNYLFEHGYQVFEVPYPHNSKLSLSKQIEHFQTRHPHLKKVHLILDQTLHQNREILSQLNNSCIVSSTILMLPNNHPPLSTPDLFPSTKYQIHLKKLSLSFNPVALLCASAHHLYTGTTKSWSPARISCLDLKSLNFVRSQLLDRVISLAELDLQCSH